MTNPPIRYVTLAYGEAPGVYRQSLMLLLSLVAHADEPYELVVATDRPECYVWFGTRVEIEFLDFAKLEALNGVHMRKMDDAELLDTFINTLPYLENGKIIADRLDEARKAQLLAAMPGLKDRAKTLVELADGAAFLFAERPLDIDEKAKAQLGDAQLTVLRGARDALRGVGGEWNAASTEASIRTFAEESGLKLGAVAQPLRAALTGRTTSPGVFDVLAVLGRHESLARIGDQID